MKIIKKAGYLSFGLLPILMFVLLYRGYYLTLGISKYLGLIGLFNLFVLFMLIGLIFYIKHALANPRLKDKTLWIIIMAFTGIGMLAYWFVHIRKDHVE